MSGWVAPEVPVTAPEQRPHGWGHWRFPALLAATAVLVFLCLLSIAVGSKQIPLGVVVDELVHRSNSDAGVVIRDLRIPRTVLGLTIGVALGLSGALMQALTRNPLADPGLLGVEAGASAAVITAIGVLHLTSASQYVWFAFLGAGVASVLVYVLGSRGRSAATPVRLALAGTAISAALGAFISALILIDPKAFDRFRFWAVGSLSGPDPAVLLEVGPFLIAGGLVALSLARPLNAIALGDETGIALGVHLGRTRLFGAIAVTLLCGAATAAVGPIAFVGLIVPHVARAITGPDQRWVLPFSMVLAPILLLAADVVGRIVARPAEIEVGIVTAFVGAPFFIALVRYRRMAGL